MYWTGAQKTLREISKIIESDPQGGVESKAVAQIIKAIKADDDFRLWWLSAVNPQPYSFMDIGLAAADHGIPAAKEALKNLVGSFAPERFTYQGFRIRNKGFLTDPVVRDLLDSIDYLVALFKKRGMLKLLHEGIREIVLTTDDSDHNAAGLYYSNSQSITLISNGILKRSPKLLRVWTHEVFLHEFGHYIHMNYITGDARRYWDSAWDPISKLKSVRLDITLEDRQRFLEVIKNSGWNVSKASKKLSGADQVKMAHWLRQAGVGPLITPKSLRLTELGQRYFGLLKDPVAQLTSEGKDPSEINEENIARRLKAVRGNLYLDGAFTFHVPEAVAKQYLADDPELGDAALMKLLDSLEAPTEYAKTDEKEDFAETWVAFMANPSALSEKAKDRMMRTLSLSGFGGKEVLRLAYNYKRSHSS